MCNKDIQIKWEFQKRRIYVQLGESGKAGAEGIYKVITEK